VLLAKRCGSGIGSLLEVVWYQNWLLVGKGIVAKIAAWYWNSCLFEGCKGVTAKPAA
jgi:hypothetical protein